MTVVLDANMIVALLLDDDHQDVARARFQRWLDAGEQFHAPSVLPYEIANVLARLVFDGVLEAGSVSGIWEDIDTLDVHLHPFELVRDGPEIAAVTARLQRKHATDSAYVCLAQRLDSTLWTLDGALARNAAAVGLPVTLVE